MALTLVSDLNIGLRSVQRTFRETTEQKADQIDSLYGRLTTVAGSVDVEGRDSYDWFKQEGSSHPVQILNRRVSSTDDLPVIVGNRPPNETVEVLEIDTSLIQELDIGAKNIVAHGVEHLPGGGDLLWIDPKQISEFAVYPAEGLSISIAYGYYNSGSTIRFPGLTSLDISTSQPASGQHRAVGIYVDLTTNSVGTVDGTAVPDGARISFPTWPSDSMPISVVDLDGDQTSLSYANDVISTKGSIATSFWSKNGTDVYYLGGKVGVGTAIPIADVQVSSASSPFLLITDTTNPCSTVIQSQDAEGFFGTTTSHPLSFTTAGTRVMTLTVAKNAGLGTSSPSTYLSGTTGLVIFHSATPGLVLANSSTRRWLFWKTGDDLDLFNQIDQSVMRFQAGGNAGFGVTVPRGQIHAYDSIGGFLVWEYDGLDATVRTIIPNGTGDVLYRLRMDYVLRNSAGVSVSGAIGLPNGSATGITVGADTVTVTVNADGSVTTSRTAGTNTIKVAYTLRWL